MPGLKMDLFSSRCLVLLVAVLLCGLLNSCAARTSDEKPLPPLPSLSAEGEALLFPDGEPVMRVVPISEDCVEVNYWTEEEPENRLYRTMHYCYRPKRVVALPESVTTGECVLPWLDIVRRDNSGWDMLDLLGYRMETLDLDGDGAKDVLITATACGKVGCPYHLYVMRGACGYFLGDHTGNLLPDYPPSRTNGWLDLYMVGLSNRGPGLWYDSWYKLGFNGSAYDMAESRQCLQPFEDGVDYCSDWENMRSDEEAGDAMEDRKAGDVRTGGASLKDCDKLHYENDWPIGIDCHAE